MMNKCTKQLSKVKFDLIITTTTTDKLIKVRKLQVQNVTLKEK